MPGIKTLGAHLGRKRVPNRVVLRIIWNVSYHLPRRPDSFQERTSEKKGRLFPGTDFPDGRGPHPGTDFPDGRAAPGHGLSRRLGHP